MTEACIEGYPKLDVELSSFHHLAFKYHPTLAYKCTESFALKFTFGSVPSLVSHSPAMTANLDHQGEERVMFDETNIDLTAKQASELVRFGFVRCYYLDEAG